jgi:uncharacterized protein YndB with AHSA1/START domain
MSDAPAADDAERGYTITRLYDAPRALVWRAITEADLFTRWFGAEAELEIAEWNCAPGGSWTGTMTWDGNEIPWAGRFLEVDEPSRLVVAVADQPELGDTFETITYTLTDKGAQTEMVLRQTGNLTPEEYEQTKEGSGAFLDELAKLLASL